MKRTLIINADDFGYTRGVNRTVERCFKAGRLRSATLMAAGAAFEDAVATARANPELGVGVHLVLTELAPLSAPEEAPGLADERGLMPKSTGALLAAIRRGRIGGKALRAELDRQIRKVLDFGVVPTHLDSHKHTHLIPEVLEAVVELARKYSISWVRNPFDGTCGWSMLPVLERGQRGTFLKQHLKARLIGAFRPYFLGRIRQAGLRTTDRFYGMSMTGLWSEQAMVRLIGSLPPGLSEWMVHPGACDEELRRMPTRLIETREVERNLLLSPLLEELLEKHDISVRRFGEEPL